MQKRPAAAKFTVVSGEIVRCLSPEMFNSKAIESAGDRCGNRAHQFVLDDKDVIQVTIVTLSPEMISSRRFDQLGSHTDPIACLADAAFDDVLRTEFASDPPHVSSFVAILKG